ncbi:MAG: UbiA prenyltransferase family protein [Planctomycetota bacterium]|nr:UbiA prenyltransferase family protein [Planctomycetota bacterium]
MTSPTDAPQLRPGSATPTARPHAPAEPSRPDSRPARPLWRSLVKLARPAQWSKSAFVLIGPLYGLRDALQLGASAQNIILTSLLAAAAFALVSSGCYVVNDIFDRVADRAHPRKRRRPLASGDVSVRAGWIFALLLFAAAAVVTLLIGMPTMPWVALTLVLYALNVTLYSLYLKHQVIADVMCLSLGFVLRVMGGCAAAGVEPSVWLLNVTFFLSMFLAFGKRLGERRTLAAEPGGAPEGRAVEHRRVQAGYTDALLQMAVVVTAVSTLMTYGSYLQIAGSRHVVGFNLMWLTMLPACYGMFRAIVMLERGRFDDPTELAVHDRPFQVAGFFFVALTLAIELRGVPFPR